MGILRSSSIRGSAIRSTLTALRALAIRADGTDGVALDPLLPTSYKDLLLWQTADEGVTTVDAVSNPDLSTWTLSGQNAVVSGQSDPVGGSAAYLLTETNTNALHYIEAAWTGTRQNGDSECDIYVKRASGTRNVAIGSASSANIVINLSDGTYTIVGATIPAAGVSVQSAGSGWYRIRFVQTAAVNPILRVFITNSATSAATYLGDGTSGLYVYSTSFVRQRMVSSVAVKDGSATVASSQGTAANRAFLINSQSLGGNLVIGSINTGLTKSLTDDPAIATALSGSDKPFTITWLCRSAGYVNANGFVLAGATAQARPLYYTTYTIAMSRTDDAAVSVTPTFGSTDFTNDQNWHVVSVVFTGTTAKLYIDGRQSPTTFSIDVGASTFTSATETMVARFWREKTIYSRALSDAERINVEAGIRARAGLTLDLESPLSLSGVQGWWSPTQTVANQNLLTLSEASIASDLTTWTPTGLTATGASPYTLTESGNNAFLTGPAITNVTANQVQFSVALKKSIGGRQWVFLSGDSGSTKGAYFDLDNGVVGTLAGATATIAAAPDIGAGWYRCTIVYTYSAGSPRIYVASADGSIATTNSGAAAYEAKEATLLQKRVSSMLSITLDRTSEGQGTASSQALIFDSQFIPSQLIGTSKAFGEATNVAARSLTTAAAYPQIFSGSDVPVTTISLVKKYGNPSANTSFLRLGGASALMVHPLLQSTGNLQSSRTDDAASNITISYGSASNVVQTWSNVFSGTQSSMFVDGVQLGTTQGLNVGVATFNSALQINTRNITCGETMIANRELTTQERIDMENGMKRRAGLI